MRTTLDIDEDVLAAAKQLAAARNSTAGQVISELARKALTHVPSGEEIQMRNGVPQLPRRDAVVTPEFIEKLLNEHV